MRPRPVALLLIVRLGIIMLLMVVGGCAKPDWIERMLVTADVNGTWKGNCYPRGGGTGIAVELTLQQAGPNITGAVMTTGKGNPCALSVGNVPVEGTLNGDVLRLSSISLDLELEVKGDEMSGAWSGGGRTGTIDLVRQGSR